MAWRVFYSYSHEDETLRKKLGTYLAPLKQQNRIVEWCDRDIEAGANWASEIKQELRTADLILLLVSAEFLASEYCFGVEVEEAMARLKRGEVKVVPVLLKPCMWQESRFSELQIIPRDAKPVISCPSIEQALTDVAEEIRNLVSEPVPSTAQAVTVAQPRHFDASLELVRAQIRAYAHLYERTRQNMRASPERTRRMEQVFQNMRNLATAAYPLLDELASSPSPGERLAAVAILEVFAAGSCLPFLVKLIGSEKPFVGYHAARALQFAVGSLDPQCYPALERALNDAEQALRSADVGFDTDRQKVLDAARQELRASISALKGKERYD